jgi:hypothetical protein
LSSGEYRLGNPNRYPNLLPPQALSVSGSYNFIMRIYFAALAVLLGMAVFIARQDGRAPQQSVQKAAQADKPTVATKAEEK